MAETPQSGLKSDWRRDAESGDLYRLYLDGEPTPRTAPVDWYAPRADQLEQLAAAGWLPEYAMASLFETIIQGDMQPSLGFSPLPAGRLYSPLPSLATVVDSNAAETSQHPLRTYLWPSLGPDGGLLLDAEERILASVSIDEPRIRFDNNVDETKLGGRLVNELTKNWRLELTDRRAIVRGEIAVPNRTRSDYEGGKSLALSLLSPNLLGAGFDDLLAQRRAKRRQRTVENLAPVAHIRYEWLAAVQLETRTVQRKKPLLTKKPAPHEEFTLYLTIWTGDKRFGRISFPFPKTIDPDAVSRATEGLLEALPRLDPALELSQPEITTAQPTPGFMVESILSRVETTQVANGIPYSIPFQTT